MCGEGKDYCKKFSHTKINIVLGYQYLFCLFCMICAKNVMFSQIDAGFFKLCKTNKLKTKMIETEKKVFKYTTLIIENRYNFLY